uniref:Pentacotripeptide-repeat region of PRORP domain-containing protein n=1 Tax=Oryza punctata TaxID=4537 RepID=A0A0E0JPV0_ORYPU
MLGSLCRSSDLASARSFFDSIPDKDVVSWSTMLACYFSQGRLAEGLAFFRTMTFTTQLAADYVMLVTVLTGCASAGLLPVSCRAIHGYVVRRGITFTMHLGTALIDCYAKAGRLDYASRVFCRVPLRNVMHWTAMICGTAAHLGSEKAIQLFEEMCQIGVQPNEMTFTAILSACGQAGLVDQGRKFFKLMVDTYGFEPTIHHYGCIVDLYAKAGKLEDAYEVIKTMRMEPNIIIWTSLLAACKKFKNFDIAVEGIGKVLSMEISEENGGLYALISDLYAMGGRWEDVLRVRSLMEERNVRKIRGSSSIKVGEPQDFTFPAVS